MRPRVLAAAVIAIVLANLLVFGAIGTNVLKPTPRPTRAVQVRATFTPNPNYARRLVTATPTRPPTATRYPTFIPMKDPRGVRGGPEGD